MIYRQFLSYIICLLLILEPIIGLAVAQEDSYQSKVGYAFLPMLQPRFPIDDAIYVLKHSKDKVFSFVYGAFGRSNKNFKKAMKAVPNAKVMIYGLCGPCRVPRRDGSMEFFHRELTIPMLNKALVNNKAIQKSLKSYFTVIKKDFIDPYPNTKFEFVPELESNFNTAAESIAINIAYEVFADSPNVTLRLNPLKQSRRLGNIPTEIHNLIPANLKALKPGDSISLDGIVPSKEEIANTIRYARKHHLDYYIWKKEWQGITNLTRFVPPSKRTYKILNREALIAYSRL